MIYRILFYVCVCVCECCAFVGVGNKLHKMHGTYVKIVFMILIRLRVSALLENHHHIFYKH